MRSLILRVTLPLAVAIASVCIACVQPDSIRDPDLVIEHATLYPSPQSPPILDATLVVRDGLIVWTGSAPFGKPYRESEHTRVIDAGGAITTAGFWNSHVHFTEPHWDDAAKLPEEALNDGLRKMLLQYGFVNVVDTGSSPENTRQLQQRIFTGEILGPKLFRAGGSFVPKGAKPIYVPDALPEIGDEIEAEQWTRRVLSQHPDGIKIFAGTFLGPGLDGGVMAESNIRVITRLSHRNGRWVIAHPQNMKGLTNALRGNVDILAHTAPSAGVWSAELTGELARSVALIPTLQLFRIELERSGQSKEDALAFQARAVVQLRSFYQAGGDVLFGTDVGYHDHYDPSEEYARMADAGMSFEAILASLTTNPARRFDDAINTGTLRLGKRADLVLLEQDPRENAAAFARVRMTVRSGTILFERN